MVPAIVYYEIKRELLRADRSAGVTRLDAFVNAALGRYVPLSDQALRLAAELWADARKTGKPTAEAKALDIDVLIAAQARSFAGGRSPVVIATTNVRHLSQFADARQWDQITP
jgi:predicted nucleic acid-binding protein